MNPYSFSPRRPGRNGGFTLVEIAVVLIIIALMMAMAAVLFRGISAGQKRSLTTARLTAIDAALVQFVAVQKRLPCPADGRLASGHADAGAETARSITAGCSASQYGVVPWRALGMSEVDATDGWDRRFTYRAALLQTADNGMDMSYCDPAGLETTGAVPRACNAACTSSALSSCTPPIAFIRGAGLTVKNNASGAAQVTLMDPAASPSTAQPTGAAYVVISHGESGGGGYTNTGQAQASLSTDGTQEIQNYADRTMPATYFVDDNPTEVAGTTHFDDLVSRPSVLAVINKAGLGPRSR
jgi:prepilin-type N-terminal cleavage/methylation domain-containing protein